MPEKTGKKKPELRSFIRAMGIGGGFGGLFFAAWVTLSYWSGAPAREAYAWGRMGFIMMLVGSLFIWAWNNNLGLADPSEGEKET